MAYRSPNHPINLYPYITEGSFKSIANIIYDRVNPTISHTQINRSNMIIYIINDGDFLDNWFYTVHPLVKHPYILISGGTIMTIPWTYGNYLDDPKLIAWFSRNCIVKHYKLFAIPLGAPNRYSISKKWLIDKYYLKSGEEIKHTIFNSDKKNIIYISFSTHNNSIPDRKKAILAIDRCGLKMNEWMSVNNMMKCVTNSKFVMSPSGTSPDCHRHWEAFYLGSIPIIIKSDINESLTKNLPFIILNSWDEFSIQRIEKEYEKLKKIMNTFNWDKLFMGYWIDLILKETTKGDDLPNNLNSYKIEQIDDDECSECIRKKFCRKVHIPINSKYVLGIGNIEPEYILFTLIGDFPRKLMLLNNHFMDESNIKILENDFNNMIFLNGGRPDSSFFSHKFPNNIDILLLSCDTYTNCLYYLYITYLFINIGSVIIIYFDIFNDKIKGIRQAIHDFLKKYNTSFNKEIHGTQYVLRRI